MTGGYLLLIFGTLLSVAVFLRVRLTPVSIGLAVITSTAAIPLLFPLGILPMSVEAAFVCALALACLALPSLFLRRPAPPTTLQEFTGHSGVALARLTVWSLLTLALVTLGTMAFMSNVSSATGQDFDSLTAAQVRLAQNTEARGGGVLVLFTALGPLLACLGIYGASRYHPAWWTLVVVALVAALTSPARTSSIGLIVTALVFLIYLRLTHSSRSETRARLPGALRQARRRTVLVALVGVAMALFVFNAVGESLGKSGSGQITDRTMWEGLLEPILLYFSGGYTAFSLALSEGTSPISQGSTVFIFARALAALDPTRTVPDTINDWAWIPMPFNLYTGFGTLYFDLGLIGLSAMMVVLGIVLVHAHQRALAGQIEWTWVSSSLVTVLLFLPLSFVLLNVDTVLRLLVGFVVFRAISTAKKLHAGTDGRKRV